MTQPAFSDDSAVDAPAEDRAAPVRLLAILLCGAMVILAVWISSQQGLLDFGAHPSLGKPLGRVLVAPLISEGEQLTEIDLQGHVTLINFWGTWCRPCLIEFPHLVELNERLSSEPEFLFLPVACGPSLGSEGGGQLRERTAEYLQDSQFDLKVYADPGGVTRRSVLTRLGGQEFPFPTTVLLDREGIIRGIWPGYREGSEDEMESEIRQLLR